jgi:flagellar biosynthesis/type III secretory pathway protein FliH
VATCPRAIEAPDAAVPAELRGLIEAETAVALDRGRREGLQEGAAAARAADDALPDALRRAFADGIAMLRADLAREADEILELAVEIARQATRRDPGDDARGLLATVRDVLAELDDAPLTLRAHPSQAAALSAALSPEGVQVAPDPTLEPGEAVVRGPWSEADLRWPARWQAVRSALNLGEPPGAPADGADA